MADDIVIRAEDLGKKYIIGHQADRERYTALRDVIARNARGFLRSAKDLAAGRPMTEGDEVEEFWALKDLSFEIARGEVVGVIGSNGAGKSTLLKVLSRITEPSEGRVEIKGRVASLLEVGTGFHPELTGRENIFLNGAILGMGHSETRRKFDEIVAFAEVEKFLDTPVKRYSSGMYVRLAFAVAAHLEPEVLIVDEVLAVGDAEFQKKCLGKMSEVAGQGRTVLFVSHNMAAVRDLCRTGIVLQRGRAVFRGPCDEAVATYLRPSRTAVASAPKGRREPVSILSCGCDIRGIDQISLLVELEIEAAAASEVEVRLFVRSTAGETPVGMISLGGFAGPGVKLAAGRETIRVQADLLSLAQGDYSLTAEVVDLKSGRVGAQPQVMTFRIERSPYPSEAIFLKSEWGLGFFRWPARILERRDDRDSQRLFTSAEGA